MKAEQKKIDALNIELTLQIAAEDYAAAEKKKLSERRRTAEFKGFRKGMVPASLIAKVYGEQCLVDAVNEVITSELDKYIEDNKLHILGEPLSSENQPEVTWQSGNDFTFVFDIALSPEVAVEVEAADTIPQYNVTVTAKDKTQALESIKKYYEEKKEEKTEEELDKEVTDRMKEQYRQEAEWRLSKDIRDFYVKKAGVELPEAFLKRWLYVANQGKVEKDQIEKEFPAFAEDFKWQLVRGYLMKKFEFTIGEKDVREAAKAFVTYQYAMYGIGNVPEDMVNEAVVNVLKDQKQVDRLVEQVEDQKVIAKIKETVTLKATKIGVAKFRELQ